MIDIIAYRRVDVESNYVIVSVTLFILHFTFISLPSILHLRHFDTARIPTKQWGHSPQNTTKEQDEISVRKIFSIPISPLANPRHFSTTEYTEHTE